MLSHEKTKDKLRMLTSRSKCGSIGNAPKLIKVFVRGWLNYFGIADKKNNIGVLNKWFYRRAQYVHLEAVEAAKDIQKKIGRTWSAGMGGLQGCL